MKTLDHFDDNSAQEGFFIFIDRSEYTFVEPVFAIIPFSIQFRCIFSATAFVLLERTDQKEFLEAEILLYFCENEKQITKN